MTRIQDQRIIRGVAPIYTSIIQVNHRLERPSCAPALPLL